MTERFHMMRKVLFIAVMVLMSIVANAQGVVVNEEGKYPVYCDMMGYNFWGFGKVKVKLDMGHAVAGKDYESLFDENGKKIKFNTMMDAVNYMAKRGWKVERTYDLTDNSLSKQTVMHFLLVKYVKDDSEINEGVNLKVE